MCKMLGMYGFVSWNQGKTIPNDIFFAVLTTVLLESILKTILYHLDYQKCDDGGKAKQSKSGLIIILTEQLLLPLLYSTLAFSIKSRQY